MSIEAMKQALNTLEGWANYGYWVWPESALDQCKRNTAEAITALRAAIDAELEQAMVEVWQTAPSWVGLSINEAQEFYESKLSRAELINKIDEFLEEKNK
jgi:hypothetical protein